MSRRRWPRYVLGSALAVVILAGVGFAAIFSVGGLRPCEQLDDRLCRDLGPGDCEIWKGQLGRVGSGSVVPHHFRGNRMVVVDVAIHGLLGWNAAKSDNRLCHTQMDEQVYPKVLAAVRDAAAGYRARAGKSEVRH